MRLSELDINNYFKIIEYKNNHSTQKLKPSSTNLPSERTSSDKPDNCGAKIIHKIHKKQRILSDDEIHQIVADYQSGMSKTEIARKFNCHECTIRYKLRNAEIKEL